MLANNPGNMRDVYLAAIKQQALASIRRADERSGPYDAEIVGGCSPKWHVVVTYPNHEKVVAGHLIARRFGIYLPESESIEIRRGHQVTARRLLLPGYVLLFVWDIDRHWRRVVACPGVQHILMADHHPAVVDDRVVDQIRAVENSERFSLKVTVEKIMKKKRWRQSRTVGVDHNDIVGVHPYSPFMEELRKDDVTERLSAFHKAMGLCLTESVS
jgi:transcription antitermination factor NusG